MYCVLDVVLFVWIVVNIELLVVGWLLFEDGVEVFGFEFVVGGVDVVVVCDECCWYVGGGG